MTSQLLHTLEVFYDAVPRAVADAREVGPLTLFVAREGWPYYGRPSLGASDIDEADVRELLRVADELGVPRSLEWVHETTPSLAGAARGAGLSVQQMPLLVLDGAVPEVATGAVTVELLEPDDERFGDVRAAVDAGFRDGDDKLEEPVAEAIRARVRDGLMRVGGAFASDGAAVGGGSSQARGPVCELTGIATLPSWRRKGIGAALTRLLAQDAREQGATTVFLSAGDDSVARVYERVGFRRVATACVAEPA